MAEAHTGKNGGKPLTVVWKPEPKQALALMCPAFELFYGGARFGGKSDFLLADFCRGVEHGQNHRGILFRRSYSELEEIIFRSKQLFIPLGAEYSETKRTWTFPSGSSLKLRFLEMDTDVHRYQGHQYTWIGFDELTNWGSDYPYLYMFSCARSPHGLPVRVRASGNPGSVGHAWVKARFVDIGPAYELHVDPKTSLKRCFIPSSLDDNSYAKNDPQYEGRLKNLPEHLYRAHRFGDWEIFVGQAFSFAKEYHVCRPLPVPRHAQIYTTFDWGFGAPFSWGWWWVDADARIFRFAEWYGWTGEINQGIRYEDSRIAEEIRRMESDLKEIYGADFSSVIRLAGPDCFNKKPDYKGGGQGPSTAETFAKQGLYLSPGDPKRELKIRQFRERLKVPRDAEGKQIGLPMMMIYDTCTQFIRTIPAIQIDPKNPEYIVDTGECHTFDDACHICMARPIELREPAKLKPLAAIRVDMIERAHENTHEDFAIQEARQDAGFWEALIQEQERRGFYSDIDGR